MVVFFIFACLFITVILLGILVVIDFRVQLLPNIYVGGFLVCGLIFHWLTGCYYVTATDMALGFLASGGLLLGVRAVSNKAYGFDTLGLGDVKLMAAGGAWLGAGDAFLAIAVGAFAGILHGMIYGMIVWHKTGEKIQFSRLSIPAGPGFIVGLVMIALFKFQNLPDIFRIF